jgi:Ca2+-binding EF-hand superfamily protein
MNIVITTLAAVAVLLSINCNAEDKAPAQPRKTIQQNILNKYDTNKNGTLDPEEKENIRKARESKRASDLQKLDTNKDGKISREERAAGKTTAVKKSARKTSSPAS